MPIHECEEDGKPGYQWGSRGHCYTYDPSDEKSREAARKKAGEQGAAAHAHGYGKSDAGMLISKTFETKHTAETPTNADLEAIRRYALRDVTADEIFSGKMVLANTLVDRSHERFPVAYLERFAATLPGKPVLTGHDQKSLPVGRFYDADVVPRSDGEHDLIARYYLAADSPLTKSIELGIASGVSIGARADKRTCKLCAKDYDAPGKDRCQHVAGSTYDGQTCVLEWGGDTSKVEAIEGSLVASPCQMGAQTVARSVDLANWDSISNSNSNLAYLSKAVPPGGTIILDYGAPDIPAPQEGSMDELKAAQEKIAALEAEITTLKKSHEDDPLVAAGKEYLDFLKSETLRMAGSVSEADKAEREALLATVQTPNLTLIKTIHGGAQKRFDEKFPPAPTGKQREDDPKEKPARFDPVAANPWRRSA